MIGKIIITTPSVVAAAFLIDVIVGDPVVLPHPVRLIGKLILFLEHILYIDHDEEKQFRRGICLTLTVIITSMVTTVLLLFAAFSINFWLGTILRVILCTYCIAACDLKRSAMKVYRACKDNDIDLARSMVSRIVGRDTDKLNMEGVIKAAVESVAESTCDGVIAPVIYMLLFGATGGITYKAINTLDSMTGYHNDRYEYFGKVSAITDDIANFIPSRVSAVLIIISSAILHLDFRNAVIIWKRDRRNHKSPNSAQTESAISGALDIRLGGPAFYFGKAENKPFIGDEKRTICCDDILISCRIMYFAAILAIIPGILFLPYAIYYLL